MNSSISDEPSRVAAITSELFGKQSGTVLPSLTNETTITLEGGADRRDDAAWLTFSGPATIVASSDYVRGQKFMLYELGLLSNYDIGYYLAGANWSDIAAMGAAPVALLSVVRYPSSLSDEDFNAILSGIRDACAAIGAHNVGGDIGTAERLILSATAIGAATPGQVLTRAGARPGDSLWLSGHTGIALAAMKYFSEKENRGWCLPEQTETELLDVWKRVRPEISLGSYLPTIGATSCQDTSDGLKATIAQLGNASNVDFEIDFESVPIHDAVKRVAALADVDPLTLVFGGSVDFRLLFTLPSETTAIQGLLEHHPTCVQIGHAAEATPAGAASAADLPGVAWSHQADPLALA